MINILKEKTITFMPVKDDRQERKKEKEEEENMLLIGLDFYT